ncbi:MAG: hypothetical protein QOJ25_2883 [Solirubrobacteraceae bacterium]|jgi:hypothetical protein|nr:hypothetical protein [Solirubrobacteraceae bacterium]
MSATEGEDGSGSKRHHGVHLDLGSLRQSGYPYRHARGRVGLEERRVHLVDRREVPHIGQVDGDAHRVPQARARGPAHGREVLEAAARLLGRTSGHKLTGPRIEGDLSRAEEQTAGAHRMHVRTDRGRGVWGGD